VYLPGIVMGGSILVVGSANVDLVMKMPRLPRPGETVTGATFAQVFGGKGANQAVAAARAGGRVAFVACVGDDAYGPQVKSSLAADGIDTQSLFVERGTATGTALIMVGAKGENCISVAAGANGRLVPERVEQARGAIAEAACVVTQCEVPAETVDHVVAVASAMGKPVILNLAPARPVSDATLARLACLTVNETEAEFLTGRPVETEGDVAVAAAALRARGPRAVVLTLGARGAYVEADGVGALVPAFAVAAVDTTSAGDVHCGALAVALVERRSLADAVRFANASAALSVTRLGAQPSAPRRAEIEALLARR
jgi:ribokinase